MLGNKIEGIVVICRHGFYYVGYSSYSYNACVTHFWLNFVCTKAHFVKFNIINEKEYI